MELPFDEDRLGDLHILASSNFWKKKMLKSRKLQGHQWVQ